MRDVYRDVGTMLGPEQMALLEGRRVVEVNRSSLDAIDSLSGSKLESVVTEGSGGARRYVLKRIALKWDWIMRATGDTMGRAVVAWQCGLLDTLPACIEHAYVACAADGEGWAILMRDMSDALVPPGDGPITPEENALFLKHMAGLHAAFWGETRWASPEFGFCSLEARYGGFTPRIAERERDGPDAIPKVIGLGWQNLEEAVEPPVAAIVRSLLDDPGPLCHAMSAFPQTVVHHDWKLGNLGIIREEPEPRTLLLDWAQLGVAPPACDLAWYLAVNSARLPVTKEEAIALYREYLAEAVGGQFAPHWWEPQLKLALLGGFVLLGWPKIVGAMTGDSLTKKREQAELDWWSQRVLDGGRLLVSG